MSKYIDAEKLIAEIDKKWKELADKNVKVGGGKYDVEIYTYLSIKKLITSLQQEQPSLPSNLDEAAEIAKELAYKTWSDGENWGDAAIKTFKAGAEWMAGQGATMEITDDTEWADLDSFVHKNVTGGSIIQIRKK